MPEQRELIQTENKTTWSSFCCIILFKSVNLIARNKFEGAQTTSQIIYITGASAHFNIVEDNTILSAVAAVYGIRIDNGSECNIVRRNITSGCATSVALTTTSNAQSLYENTRLDADVSTASNIYNVEISAPVMPITAIMPRRFRIYRTTTTSGAGALAPQGADIWEFALYLGGVGNRFNKFSPTMTTVDI